MALSSSPHRWRSATETTPHCAAASSSSSGSEAQLDDERRAQGRWSLVACVASTRGCDDSAAALPLDGPAEQDHGEERREPEVAEHEADEGGRAAGLGAVRARDPVERHVAADDR